MDDLGTFETTVFAWCVYVQTSGRTQHNWEDTLRLSGYHETTETKILNTKGDTIKSQNENQVKTKQNKNQIKCRLFKKGNNFWYQPLTQKPKHKWNEKLIQVYCILNS